MFGALAIVALGTATALAYVEGDGKGKAEADCLIGLEGYTPGDQSPFGKKGKPAIQCTDCDPACDLDGVSEANGSCTFSIAVRVNDAGDPACTPAALKKVRAKAKTKGTKINFSTSFQPPLDGSSATSAFVNFPVLVKKFGKPKVKAGTGKVSLLAKKLEKPKLTDKDKFTFACNPRPEGEACPGGTTSTSTSTTIETTTSTSTSTTIETTTSTSTSTTTIETTTSTLGTTTTSSSTSTVTTTSTSTTTSTMGTVTTTSTSTTTSTAPSIGAILAFTTGPAGGICGEARQGGASGTILKTLTCGGLNIGGGCAEEGGSCGVNEGPTPANATTNFNAVCTGPTCAVTARTAAQTGSNTNCSNTGCQFGTWLSIANGGTSTCVLNTFATPGSGTLDLTSGAFDGSVPLTSAVTLTGNGLAPCPLCLVGGVPGQGVGVCSAAAANSGAACVGINSTGDNYACLPAGVALTPFGVDLTPISTGMTFMDTVTDQDQVPGGVVGEFCPGQDAIEPGSFGCFALGKGAPAGAEPLCDYIEERGSNATGVTIDGGTVATTWASVFCIPAAGNGLIDGAADLPGPGATSLPGTLELISIP